MSDIWDAVFSTVMGLLLVLAVVGVIWYVLTHVPESPAAAEPLSRKVQREVGT